MFVNVKVNQDCKLLTSLGGADKQANLSSDNLLCFLEKIRSLLKGGRDRVRERKRKKRTKNIYKQC